MSLTDTSPPTSYDRIYYDTGAQLAFFVLQVGSYHHFY